MRLVAAVLVMTLAAPVSAFASDDDPWFGRDKALHFGAGAVLAGGGYSVAAAVTEKPKPRILTGVGVSVGASAAKEWYDRSHRGDPSWRDFAWGSVGAAAGVTIAWLIERGQKKDRTKPALRTRTAN
jgi:putative lipoprotein